MALGGNKLNDGGAVEKTVNTMQTVAKDYVEDKEKMKLFTFNMNPEDREKLRHHFMRQKGMNWSQGIRAVLYEYMEQQGLV